ncbi:uncharacterized protein LOC119833920 [Zerene cesonia]|uniref:uncharacterized protein LOC119833920 n=1 Tax=Zerene cesonia TaxID=33412 RepID=UPI0018E5195B|nr:uncharacterized protein LOC119833920 [Zerene cesonia]
MIGKLAKARSNECSCRIGRICSSCKRKTIIRPTISVEKPRNLPVPITISYYNPANRSNPKQRETVVNFLPKSMRWRSRRNIHEPPPLKRLTPICRWYRRRRALNQLAKEHDKELAAIEKRKRKEFEEERLNDFIRWEQLKSKKTQYIPPPKPNDYLEYIPPPTPIVPVRKLSLPKPREKVFYIKETPKQPAKKYKAPKNIKSAKKSKASKAITVRKYNHRQSITNKFVNCCYRICCQFYCYLTCILLIIFSVICLV